MLIQEIKFGSLLSFGPKTPPLKMERLNILVGPNGSGKSNFIEALGLLRSAATRLAAPMRGAGGGGVTEWIWKGEPKAVASIDAVINAEGRPPLRHHIAFCAQGQHFELIDERIENTDPYPGQSDVYFYYRFQNGRPVLSIRDSEQKRQLQRQDIVLDESILSQRRDPDQYPEMARLAGSYEKSRLFREWSFGRTSVFRAPQAADLRCDILEENFSNLGLFLNHLRSVPKVKNTIISQLRNLYEGLDDFDVRIKGGTVEVFLTEGDFVIPASRLSDGTLRFLCLLAILCDPDPPPLICIEEPELGLHPDMIPRLADLLVSASDRTQLVVTTHSDILVDAMTESPQCVVVFEKHDRCTQATRLNEEELAEWLKEYRLGQLWTRGQIGGTRW
ncbi:chromosome segregation protein SMC [Planctomycetia bacterium]|nr:chromosome segregation protein SMC [Planctomycetia bacterium]